MTVRHTCTLQEIHSVLMLGEKQASRSPRDGDDKEEMQVAEVSHVELFVEIACEAL